MPEVGPNEVRQRIAILAGFTCGQIKGEAHWVLSPLPSTGQLPEPWASDLVNGQRKRSEAYMAHHRAAAERMAPDAPRYVVYSHGTPVAWLTLAGDVITPDMAWATATQRKHGALARRALQAVKPSLIQHLQEMG